MLIELDEITPEALQLVVDTLEHYEMYRLCIMMYSRFKVADKIGKFVSAICDKYSNLNQFRLICSEKFQRQVEIEAQQKYSIIAHEAVQNVLNLVGSQFDAKNQWWIEKSFDGFFVQGYWKKLVFMMQSDSSIELSWAMSDTQSLKLQFLVQQAGISDPEKLKSLMENNSKFSKILKQDMIVKNDLIGSLIRNSIFEEDVSKVVEQVFDLI